MKAFSSAYILQIFANKFLKNKILHYHYHHHHHHYFTDFNLQPSRKLKKCAVSVSSLSLGCQPQFLMLRPIAHFTTSENLIIIGKFARWTSSGRRKDSLLDLGLKKWKISMFISVGFSPISVSSLNLKWFGYDTNSTHYMQIPQAYVHNYIHSWKKVKQSLYITA